METKKSYKLHWHVLLTHFPLSLYATAFGFQILHFFFYPDCLELATTVTLIGGTFFMIPVVVSGWLTWKNQYQSAMVKLFKIKIYVALAMLIIGISLCIWRIVHFTEFLVEPTGLRHWTFFSGIFSLIAGALVEGYHGGRLNH